MKRTSEWDAVTQSRCVQNGLVHRFRETHTSHDGCVHHPRVVRINRVQLFFLVCKQDQLFFLRLGYSKTGQRSRRYRHAQLPLRRYRFEGREYKEVERKGIILSLLR